MSGDRGRSRVAAPGAVATDRRCAFGSAGTGASVRGGWLDQTERPSDERVNDFVSGWGATAGGTVAPFSFGETYGFPRSATEVGIGYPSGGAGSRTYSVPVFRTPGW